MAKNIKHGLIMVVDPTTGALFPWLQRTLARLVIFPDGRNLFDHWQEEMSEVNKAKFRIEQTQLGDNIFNWETNTFGTSNAVLKLHVVMAVPTQPGNNRYVYKIKLPTKYIPDGRQVDYDDASFSVFERENSTFSRNHCLHNVFVNVDDNKELQVIVDHLKNIDNVNLNTKPYITGSFDITCNLAFKIHRSTSLTS